MTIDFEYLPVKDFAEMPDHFAGNVPHVKTHSQNPFQRSDAMIGNSARNDQTEIIELCRYVQRKPVHGNPAGDAHSDCCQFLVAYPNTGQPGDASGGDVEICGCPDEDLLDVAHIAPHVTSIRSEVNDGIADQLSRSVIGHSSASSCFKQLDTLLHAVSEI